MKPSKDIYRDNVNVSPPTPLKSLLGLTVGLVALIGVLLGAVVLLSSVLTPHIPASWETKMGEPHRAMFRSMAVQGRQADRVRRAFSSLEPYLSEDDRRLDYLPLVIQDDLFNAFALPGGTIVVMTGLLDEVDSDEELAFVLAHELGHFHGRDHLRGLGLNLGVQLISAVLMGTNSGGDFLTGTTSTLLGLHYSRAQEKAADLFALDLLRRADLPLDGAVSFMEKTRGMDDRSTFESYFSTHPHSDERLHYIREELGQR